MQTLHSPTQAAEWLRQHVTGVLCTDSRAIQKGDGFIAWPGMATDGRAYVASAFEQGATACLVEAEDTADEARRIAADQCRGIAAIASKEAAALFGLTILAPSIQTIQNNVTRFVIIQKKGEQVPQEKINKAALKFILDHQRGSLAAVLNVMSDCQLNLTKIQSLPVIETPGKYAFFVDVTFEQFEHYDKARKLIAIMASKFKILGEYAQHIR